MPERYAGAIVVGPDVHLRQITFDCLDSSTGEVTRGRIAPTPAAVGEWVAQFAGREVHAAMEACTGWLFVAEAVTCTGGVAHLAETVETRAIDERTQWLLRIRSVLYHHGVSAGAPGEISGPNGREFLNRLGLPDDACERVTVALRMVDTLEREIHQIERSLRRLARHQPGCQALMTQFGVGELIALTVLTELGDVTRMSSSRKAVRFAGIDIGVHRSDQTARVGKLTRQGSSSLRWALYEAAQSATRRQSPDYADYHALKPRGLTHTRVTDDRAQNRPAQLPPVAQPRTRHRSDKERPSSG
jgi:transposase